MGELRRYSLLDNENQTLVDWFSPLLYNIHNKACAQREPLPEAREHRQRKKPSTAQGLFYFFLANMCRNAHFYDHLVEKIICKQKYVLIYVHPLFSVSLFEQIL